MLVVSQAMWYSFTIEIKYQYQYIYIIKWGDILRVKNAAIKLRF